MLQRLKRVALRRLDARWHGSWGRLGPYRNVGVTVNEYGKTVLVARQAVLAISREANLKQ